MNAGIQVTLYVIVPEGSVSHHQGVPDPIILLGGKLPKGRTLIDPITWIGVIERIKGTKIVQILDPDNLGDWRDRSIHQMSLLGDPQVQIIKMSEVHHHQKMWQVGNNKSIFTPLNY